ncbi:MAG TPA: endolytic transglycosylase MltG [Candidatus Paceibacterota bacterium]|nr:endolytic transglycosylase MltG [Candidatus Paceibacterota bacterium]
MLSLCALGIVVIVFVRHAAPPINFPSGTTITIDRGEPFTNIARELKSTHIIRSMTLFRIGIALSGGDRSIPEGQFYFAHPINVFAVAFQIAGKNFRTLQNVVTFPEGYTNAEMATRLKEKFPSFDTATFLEQAKPLQGMLFPDTYSFSPHVSVSEVIATLSKQFEEKMTPLASAIAASGHSEHDIIVMASLIEKEADGEGDAPVIAGILWKRIAAHIPLQVDAPLAQLLGKKSDELTFADLKLNSPYNTYVHLGLPPDPIDNPGLRAIDAALHPTDSPYLYYLHDARGTVHYARTLNEHNANKALYLK